MSDHDRKFDPQHIANLDSPERLRHIPPTVIREAVRPRAGDALADLGSGAGYFLWPLVEAVDGEGTFYAVDSSAEMLGHLRQRAAAHPLGAKVQPVLASDDRVPLPDGSLDLAVMGSVYHEFADRPGYLREVWRLLRPGGRLVVMDWRPLPPGTERTAGPPPDHRIAEETARTELLQAGYEVQARSAFESLWCLEATRPA